MISFRLVIFCSWITMVFIRAVDYPQNLYFYCEYSLTETFFFIPSTGISKALSFMVENNFCIGFCQDPRGFNGSEPLNFAHSLFTGEWPSETRLYVRASIPAACEPKGTISGSSRY